VGPDQVVKHLQNTILTFVSNFTTNSVLEVQEEKQLNKWFGDILDPILRSYGCKMNDSFPDNKCCIFGSSRPDVMFSNKP